MRLNGIRVADVIEADVRGLRFFARVEQVDQRALEVEPLCNLNGSTKITYRHLPARQVIGHYRRAAGSR